MVNRTLLALFVLCLIASSCTEVDARSRSSSRTPTRSRTATRTASTSHSSSITPSLSITATATAAASVSVAESATPTPTVSDSAVLAGNGLAPTSSSGSTSSSALGLGLGLSLGLSAVGAVLAVVWYAHRQRRQRGGTPPDTPTSVVTHGDDARLLSVVATPTPIMAASPRRSPGGLKATVGAAHQPQRVEPVGYDGTSSPMASSPREESPVEDAEVSTPEEQPSAAPSPRRRAARSVGRSRSRRHRDDVAGLESASEEEEEEEEEEPSRRQRRSSPRRGQHKRSRSHRHRHHHHHHTRDTDTVAEVRRELEQEERQARKQMIKSFLLYREAMQRSPAADGGFAFPTLAPVQPLPPLPYTKSDRQPHTSPRAAPGGRRSPLSPSSPAGSPRLHTTAGAGVNPFAKGMAAEAAPAVFNPWATHQRASPRTSTWYM